MEASTRLLNCSLQFLIVYIILVSANFDRSTKNSKLLPTALSLVLALVLSNKAFNLLGIKINRLPER